MAAAVGQSYNELIVQTVLGLLILFQMPFVFIAFCAAGTDGKASSQIAIWRFVVPIGLCELYSIYRIGFVPSWGTTIDYVTAAISCVPLTYVLGMLLIGKVRSR